MFPDLILARDGYGKYISRWFNESYLVKVGVKNKKNNFHSLRSNFTDNLKQQLIDEKITAELTGHSEAGISYDRYAKPVHVEMLYQQGILKLNYKNINWLDLKK
jgi:integrase